MSAKVVVLGSVQDGGYPQIGCNSICCQTEDGKQRFVSCLGIMDEISEKYWLIDITPDFKHQLKLIGTNYSVSNLAGVFISHAHFGHYTGMLELGKEVMNTDSVPVYVLPKMAHFLEHNDPWKQLVHNENIKLIQVQDNEEIALTETVSVHPFLVPHRAEISETAGFKIQGESKSIIYLPDIDSWEEWETDLCTIIKENDILLLDGTFFCQEELLFRDIEVIPHPCINHTMEYLDDITETDKSKIYFTHLNHTNNALRQNSREYQMINEKGFNIAKEKMEFII